MDPAESMRRLLDIAALDRKQLPERALRLAELSLFDWMVVGQAGADQPVSTLIRGFVEEDGGKAEAAVIGSDRRLPARAAALANGTISHALDYDDTHFAYIGHPSVAIFPAALAAAESIDALASDVRDAFLLGAEATCRIGMVLGRIHYQRGFHQTATAGAFGATIAAGRIYGLSRAQMRHALSLVSGRACGLKSQFGTMGKPFNAGTAAANGVDAARLASRGFLSCEDGIAAPQGFIETHSDAPEPARAWQDPPPRRFVFEDITYKLHACCHGTHAMIEALRRVRGSVDPSSVTRIKVMTHPRWLRVCDVKAPRSGLELKFSYAFLAAMVMRGIDTAASRTYTDALCGDPALQALAARVDVQGDEALGDTQCRVDIELSGGRHVETAHDLAANLPVEALGKALQAKARALLGEAQAQELWCSISEVDRLSARALAALLARRPTP
jgi:2-methylcitrate dehydratase PrpD